MSDEINKAIVVELCKLITQAHKPLFEEGIPNDAKHALFTFGNYIAARARTRLWAVEDQGWREEFREGEVAIERLADIHLSDYVPNPENEEEKPNEPTSNE